WVRNREQEALLGFQEISVNGHSFVEMRSGRERRTVQDRRSGFDRRFMGDLFRELDIKKGMNRFGGDREIYLGVLRSFAQNTKPLLEAIKAAQHDDWDDYTIRMHGLKGASRGIFAEEIAIRAEELEKAAKLGNIEFIDANNDTFVEIVEKLVADLDEMLARLDAENPKPRKERPDGKELAKLLAACKAYDMDGLDDAMASLEAFEYLLDGGLVVSLREAVDEADFEQIAVHLKVYGLE
ncbi:MAG: hypothetical protein FWE65_01310, partial [Eggerthellaceae bacterium]|nr:hypothetical protein [Eggerthellaceae bacterium]